MSKYDPTTNVISNGRANWAALITELKALSVNYFESAYDAAVTTANSTSYTVSKALSVTGVTVDQILFVLSQSGVSGSTGADIAAFRHVIGGVDKVNYMYKLIPTTTSTGGKVDSVFLMSATKDVSGTISCEHQFQRNAGSGTIYVCEPKVWAFLVKRQNFNGA